MVRQRNLQQVQKIEKPQKQNSKQELLQQCNRNSSSGNVAASIKKVMIGIIVAIAAYVAGKGYLETRVNTPYDEHKVGIVAHLV